MLKEGGIPADFIRDNEFYEMQLYTFDLLSPSQYYTWFSNLVKGRDKAYGEIIVTIQQNN